MKRSIGLIVWWWLVAVPFTILSPIFDLYFNIYFYYKREFLRTKEIIDKLSEKIE